MLDFSVESGPLGKGETLELIGIDDAGTSFRLGWGDGPGWTVQRESSPGRWTDVGVYGEEPPVRALPFARWLLALTNLHHDIIEDFVESLRGSQPRRFNDPYLGASENVADIHIVP
jgi:hypothetical protein